jgi:regulator of sigma E protease
MPQLISHLLGTLEYIFAIVTLLGGVIAIHELGHFLFAKWNGIRVDTFSIGFGPKLFAKKWGETEYALSLIPLGGFVKIYGQDPEEVAKDPDPKPERSFSHKGLMAKISVLFGGPLFNYLLAIGIFGLLAVAGVQKLPSIATRVIAETPAYQAGLRSGDQILAVEGQPTKTFEDVAELIAKNPEKTLKFSILREGAPKELDIKVQKEHALTPYGEQSVAGVLEGLDPLGREPILATTLASHPWGFKSGDKIVEVDGLPVTSWEELEKGVARSLAGSPAKMRFAVERGKEKVAIESGDIRSIVARSNKDVHEFLNLAGLHNPELFIQEVVGGQPAALAGVKVGDRIISANGKRVYSFEHLRGTIQAAGEAVAKKIAAQTGGAKVADDMYPNAVTLELEREGKVQTITSAVRATSGKDPLGETIVTYTMGILSAGKPQMPPNLIIERTFNPFKALYIGVVETVDHTVMTVVGLKKLAFGEVSAKSVGGPIMIGKLAGDTFSSRGWRDFLRIMAIISISLGVFNLIPIPILDGGHIVFAVIESIRGRPLSQGVQQAALKVGLSLILVLMVFALFNDITRVLPSSLKF